MNIKSYFDYNPELELTVAQIGINKWDWVSIDKKDELQAAKIMLEQNFDILPIDEGSSSIESYFKTQSWGDYSKIEISKIAESQKIYYRISFFDLLKKMKNEKKNFYFLIDSENVLGLITISNLNSLAVYNYIYQITADLERKMSGYIQNLATEKEILNILEKTSDKAANGVIKSFKNLKDNNQDNSIFQSLYFPMVSTILKNLENKIPLEHEKLLEYRKKFNADQVYGSLRNEVAHPVKLIFTSFDSIIKVNELITDYYDIIDIINK
ncbi:MAG: hypothetical protein ABFS35_22315 [Bacteroidota bacterium]